MQTYHVRDDDVEIQLRNDLLCLLWSTVHFSPDVNQSYFHICCNFAISGIPYTPYRIESDYVYVKGEYYIKIKHDLRHENKVNENKVSYCEALRYI